MNLLPTTFVGRCMASIWIVLCLCVLLFGFVQQNIHDMPVAFMWFMIFLSFPVGFLGIAFDYFIIDPIARAVGYAYHPFTSLIPSWFAMTVLGYYQWFKLAPIIVSLLFRALGKSAA